MWHLLDFGDFAENSRCLTFFMIVKMSMKILYLHWVGVTPQLCKFPGVLANPTVSAQGYSIGEGWNMPQILLHGFLGGTGSGMGMGWVMDTGGFTLVLP